MTMKVVKCCASLLILACAGTPAQQPEELPHPEIVSLFSRNLEDLPGKEAQMITVAYPPGGADPVHRHNAHAFVYVLDGTIVMQVEGGEQVTLTEGDTFYEGPDDVHTVGRNASDTEPAKFVVLLVKDKGAAPLVPVP
jgi:quercetin dioxygenase-like cupin family protein